jgi:hypothetical protein
MDADHAIQANFEETAVPTFTLTVSSGGLGSVTVPGEGVFTYDQGTIVDLVATPDAGRFFNNWTGNVANVLLASTTITMNQNEAVIAYFRTTGGGGGGGGGGGVLPPSSPTPTPGATASPSPAPEPTASPPPAPTVRPMPQPTAAPTTPGDSLDLSGVIDDNGVVQQGVSYTSPDGTLEIAVGSGTTALTEGDDPLPAVVVEKVCQDVPPPPANAYLVGCAYDFGPDGATFDPPITITLNYDPAEVPEGVAEEDLVVAYYNVATGQWVILPSTVDTTAHTITATVDHLTLFAAYATVVPAPPPVPGIDEETNIWVIAGPAIGVIVLGIIVFLVLRRRPRGPEGAKPEEPATGGP